MSRISLLLTLLTLIIAGLLPQRTPAQDLDPTTFFESKIRPLLAERCHECHAGAERKGGLSLDSRAQILEGGDTGPAAIPGNPADSLLIQAVHYDDDILKMPPKGRLDDTQIANLESWIKNGLAWPDSPTTTQPRRHPSPEVTAADRQFWSFQPIRQPELPKVNDTTWPRSPIDQFILAEIEARNLNHAPEADRRAWLRRVSYDLIGLPPSPSEVANFLSDIRPDAYERIVDRLLASPQHGERWARHWLDLVRYADSRDSRGIGGDTDITEAWRYRDWVVQALNTDTPYNQFLIAQIAGDLIPGPGPEHFNADGMVATGLLTIGEWGTGDADKEKMLTDIVDDQIDVVGRVFLGLTLACARCHDHKFDPIPTADYYGLAGIFFSTRILPDPGIKTGGSPMLRTPIVPPSVVEASKNHTAELARLEAELRTARDQAITKLLTRELNRSSTYIRTLARESRNDPDPSGELDPDLLRAWRTLLGQATEGRLLNRPASNILDSPGVHAWRGENDWASLSVNTTNEDRSLLTFLLKKQSVAVHPGPRSDVAISWTSPIDGSLQIRGAIADADPAGGDGIAWSLEKIQGTRLLPIAQGQINNAGEQAFSDTAPPDALDSVPVHIGDRIRLRINRKAEYTCDTTRLSFILRTLDGRHVWDLTSTLLDDPLGQGNPRTERLGGPPIWRFLDIPSVSTPIADRPPLLDQIASAIDANDPTALAHATTALENALKTPDSPLHTTLLAPTSPLRTELNPATAHFDPSDRNHLTALESRINTLRANPPPTIPLALVAQDGGVPNSAHDGIKDAHIHMRGDYRRLGDLVPRHFPRVIAGDKPPSTLIGSGRSELAHWLATADNPLTPRVIVNRIWQHHFGEGLVRTPSNFGALGERPTHPALLDYLAARFVASGWSIKQLHRDIVLTAAYRQSSHADPATLAADPDNLWLARANRRRLEAEPLRDSLLAAAGRLDPTPAGPAFRDFNTPRRSLYLMAIRSDRSSFGPLFDAADPAAIIDERTESTVAPQSLFLLNHPFPIAAAESLADRAITSTPNDPARVEFLYQQIFQRSPDATEQSLALNALTTLSSDNPRQAWTLLVHALLCSNEFLYID